MNESVQTTPGRVALVTGGARGIGRAIADRLHAAGRRVVIVDRAVDGLPEHFRAIVADLTEAAQVDDAFAEIERDLGPVEILVANAGVTKDTLVMRMSDDDWRSTLDVNLTGSFYCARRAARAMAKARFGRMVFIGSVVGSIGSAGQVNYAATKAGLIGMARSLARELGGRGVTANVVAPGFIETKMTEVLPADVRAAYLEKIPLGRLGQVDDIARAVEFLTLDETGYVTGAVMPVDGGIGMGH